MKTTGAPNLSTDKNLFAPVKTAVVKCIRLNSTQKSSQNNAEERGTNQR